MAAVSPKRILVLVASGLIFTGKPYIGITVDDRFAKRAAEQLKNGRIIRPLISGLSRFAAKGGEQTGISAGGLQNLENQINSISPNSGALDEAAAQGESKRPTVDSHRHSSRS